MVGSFVERMITIMEMGRGGGGGGGGVVLHTTGAFPMCYSTGHVARRDIPMCYSTSHVAGGAIPMYYSTGRAPPWCYGSVL